MVGLLLLGPVLDEVVELEEGDAAASVAEWVDAEGAPDAVA